MLTAHQPNYLPYPGFFQKIAAADEFLVVDTTQFVKRGPFGWIHRNRIRSRGGPQWLSLPVLSKGKYVQSIAEAELNPRVDWARKHFKAIEFNYRTAPHWGRYETDLREIYQRSWSHLAQLNGELIGWFLRQLELDDRPVHYASALRATGKSTAYIVDFCRELGATEFLSGIHGRDYLEVPLFEQHGIELRFQAYAPPRYAVDPAFVSIDDETISYSMLDMMMWVGPRATTWVHEIPELQTA
ncbi:MAG: WbqC family protein [Planctomycetes bacterium]|nr:WbqC family protein [Planctomycetota bacterium]